MLGVTPRSGSARAAARPRPWRRRRAPRTGADCDLEPMVLTSRLSSCVRKSSRRPAAPFSSSEPARSSSRCAAEAGQLLGDVGLVGEDAPPPARAAAGRRSRAASPALERARSSRRAGACDSVGRLARQLAQIADACVSACASRARRSARSASPSRARAATSPSSACSSAGRERAPQRFASRTPLTDGEHARLRGDQRERHRLGEPERVARISLERAMVAARQLRRRRAPLAPPPPPSSRTLTRDGAARRAARAPPAVMCCSSAASAHGSRSFSSRKRWLTERSSTTSRRPATSQRPAPVAGHAMLIAAARASTGSSGTRRRCARCPRRT